MQELKILPRVSIIIVNYNGINLLKQCFESLVVTSYPNFEIIFVDNNSSDGSVDFVKHHFPSCKIISFTVNNGYAKANNIAAKNVQSKYIVFLNNDTYVNSNWLRELVAVMENDESIVIAQSLLLRPSGEVDSSGDFVTSHGRGYSSKTTGSKEPSRILSARGAAMITKRDFFLSIGGFDEDYFFSFEDVEIGWRANILGYKVVMIPDSVVYHIAGATLNNMSSITTFHGLKNQLSLITTHFETRLAITNILLYFARLLLAFLKLALNLGLDKKSFDVNKKAAARAVLWYIRNLDLVWKKHRKINSSRKVTTTELIRDGLITNTE